MAKVQFKMSNYGYSMKYLNEVLKYDPKNAEAFVIRGNTFMMRHEYDEAIRDLSNAYQIDSRSFGVKKKLMKAQKMKKKAGRKNYYKILNLSQGKLATDADIRKAYKDAAFKWHPDKNTGTQEMVNKAERMFKEINEAKIILGNAEKRYQYD